MTVTLITGADKGLGRETARRLVNAGYVVYAAARDPEAGRAAADELGARFVALDTTDADSVAGAADAVEREQGLLDVLVNNAGIAGPHRDVPALTGDDAALVFETNVVGNVRVTHAFLPLLARSDAPQVINVVSGTGSFARVTDPSTRESEIRMPLYSSSKSALTMLTVQYAKAFPAVRFNAADPGETPTDLNASHGGQTLEQGTEAIVRLALLGAEAPTGAFVDRAGPVGW